MHSSSFQYFHTKDFWYWRLIRSWKIAIKNLSSRKSKSIFPCINRTHSHMVRKLSGFLWKFNDCEKSSLTSEWFLCLPECWWILPCTNNVEKNTIGNFDSRNFEMKTECELIEKLVLVPQTRSLCSYSSKWFFFWIRSLF